MTEIKKKTNWVTNEITYYIQNVTNRLPELPRAVYVIDRDIQGVLFLKRIGNEFNFPYKVYGLEKDFIKRVLKTFSTKKGNLGLLLNGVKGTGKTVTAEIIANKVDLPIILVTKDYQEATAEFINSIEQDVVVFFDEYEKIYTKENHTVLTVMDGVLNNIYKRLFLLTTNMPYVNDYMLSRPSRIRYVKQFSDLSIDVIEEIVDDMLQNKSYRSEVIKYVSTLRLITVDIVKSIVEEVNIHDELPEKFKEVFNVAVRDDKFNIFDITDPNKPFKLFSHSRLNPSKFNSNTIDSITNCHVNSKLLGKITKIISDSSFAVEIKLTDDEFKQEILKIILDNDKDALNNVIDPTTNKSELSKFGGSNSSTPESTYVVENDYSPYEEKAYEPYDGESESKSASAGYFNLDEVKGQIDKRNKKAPIKAINRVISFEYSYGTHYSFYRYL